MNCAGKYPYKASFPVNQRMCQGDEDKGKFIMNIDINN
jgi:hypothetical protein